MGVLWVLLTPKASAFLLVFLTGFGRQRPKESLEAKPSGRATETHHAGTIPS